MPSENIYHSEQFKKCDKCGVVVSRKPSENVELRYICDCTSDPKSIMKRPRNSKRIIQQTKIMPSENIHHQSMQRQVATKQVRLLEDFMAELKAREYTDFMASMDDEWLSGYFSCLMKLGVHPSVAEVFIGEAIKCPFLTNNQKIDIVQGAAAKLV